MPQSPFVAELLGRLRTPFTGETLFDCLSDLVFFIKNARGQYVVVNQTLVSRCGVSEKRDLLGHTVDEVFPRPFGQAFRVQDNAVLKSGAPILNQLELHLYPAGSSGWCLTNKLPLHGRDGRVVGLAGVSKDLRAPDPSGDEYAQVACAVRHVQENVGQPHTIDDLARRACLSPYQFDQRIRRLFQISAGQFLLKVRMDSALWSLRASDTPIAVVALACGYSDQSAFTRQFKQAVGVTPAQYRKAWREVEAKPRLSVPE